MPVPGAIRKPALGTPQEDGSDGSDGWDDGMMGAHKPSAAGTRSPPQKTPYPAEG
jgi:hypothetical protein